MQLETRLDAGLGVVAGDGFRETGLLAAAERHLHCAVTVLVGVLHLCHAVRQNLDDRDRLGFASVSENTGHAALAANQTDAHLHVLIYNAPASIGWR